MVAAIRRVDAALGDGRKRPAECEMENIVPVRRAIIAIRPIAKGEILSDANIAVRRPATGLSAAAWPDVIGTEATRSFAADEPIEI